LITQGAWQVLTAPLAPRHNKATQPPLHAPVDLTDGQIRIPKAEVISPAGEKPVQLVDKFCQGYFNPDLSPLAQPLPDPVYCLGKRQDVQITSLSKVTTVKTKGKV